MLRTLGAGLRTFFLAPVFLVDTMITSARANRVAHKGIDHDRIDTLATDWTRRFMRVPPITITVEGMEHVDPNQQYIVVSNHLSNFDIPVTVQALQPLRTRFIAKIEVSKIPIFGEAAVHAGAVMVDRDAVRSSHETLNREVKKSLANGHSILVFAEGTRSRTGEMGEFRRGAARLALATGTDILPIVIHGTYEVNPPGSIVVYPGEVTVRVLPPIPVDGLTSADVPAITDELRRQIGEQYDELASKQRQS